jgi:hypothetical protein
VVRDEQEEYLGPVPPDQDETAFELYKIVRRLRTDQQVSLLILVQALVPVEPE